MRIETLAVAALASLGLCACLPASSGGGGDGVLLIEDDAGGASGADAGADVGGGPGEDAGGEDASVVEEDGGWEDAGPGLPEGCLAEGLEVASAEASQTASGLTYTGSRSRGATSDQIFLFLEGEAIEPGVYPFEEVSFADCEACLVIQTGCDDAGCEASYMARDGAIEVVSAAPVFRARVRDLRLTPVTISDAGTTVLGGDAYCMLAPVELEADVEVDPCAGWTDPNFVDTNCGPADLDVTWDVSGVVNDFDRFERVEWDFGDGSSSSSFSATTATHRYSRGEWRAEVRVVGFYEDTRVTITTPEVIRVY